LLSRRGRSLPANASGCYTHRDSIQHCFDCSDWELRAAFFDNIPSVAICLGGAAVDETVGAFILPCILQALADYEQTVSLAFPFWNMSRLFLWRN
jgi:hypothetical protein